MSTTAVETKGTNKALFRTAALAGSAVIWGSLGYLALTYVPKYQGAPPDVDTTIVGVRKPVIVDPPPPPPIVRPEPDRTILPSLQPTTSAPPITTRPTTNTNANPLPSELPAGPASSEPVIFEGVGAGTLPEPTTVAPIIPDVVPFVPEVVEPPAPPPVAKLVINPVRSAGTNPTFPTRALERGVSGEVTMSFTVSPTGSVENIQVTGEEPRGYGFARAAREAIQGWTFQPQTIDGVPVAYPARYTISFKLED